MSGPFYNGKFFNGGFFASAGDTHDGFDASEVNKRLDRQREARDADRLSKRESLRAMLEEAFAEDAPAPVAAEIRQVAAPAVKRMESGRLRIDWAAMERRQLDERLYAFREAFLREQYELEADEEDILMLAGSLH